jgi:alpha-ketoglutarate-dependent taurine dioxygenase
MAVQTKHEPIPATSPTLWKAGDLRDPSLWALSLVGEDASELLLRQIEAALFDGLGFVVVDGFTTVSDEDAGRLFLEFGRLLGHVVPQNRQGSMLGIVRTESSGKVRGARTSHALLYHTDTNFTTATPAVIGLLAVREAKEGGESLVVSAHTLHNVLLSRDSESLARLYEPFVFDRSDYVSPDESPVVEAPVFERRGDRVLMLYNRARIHRGHRVAQRPLEERDLRALDAVDALLTQEEDEHAVTFKLKAGSALFANNRVTLHNRTAFSDDDPERGRLLLRMWLDPS